MLNLTIIIPAKNEEQCLPSVLNELKAIRCKKIIVLEKNDYKTINSIKKYKCRIIKQKKLGYGNAIIEGLKKSNSKYSVIFNADGSFDPKYIINMLDKISEGFNFIFASRYEKNGGSDDDTLLTYIGNILFTTLVKILFKIKISDILFTYILGETTKFKKLDLKNKDFRICVEIPLKIEKQKLKYSCIPSYERIRIAGKKKVNEFRDGFLILIYIFKMYLKKNV
jgi:glycosyltransferase involved in cell wall biosynthesis